MGFGLILFAIIYVALATADLAFCFSGRYAKAGVPVPAIARFNFNWRHGFPYLAISHALMVWWLFDTGWYGKQELPGALLVFLHCDALLRSWQQLRASRTPQPVD